MTIATLLRAAAVATAVIGVADPSFTIRRPAPVAVSVEAAAGDAAAAADVRQQIERNLADTVNLDADVEPAAVVLVGGADDVAASRPEGVSVSTVTLPPASRNVRILSAPDPDRVRLGWSATVHSTLEAHGMAGTTSRVVLEERGVELSHVEHKWTGDIERFDAVLRFTPPSTGTTALQLRVVPADGESTATDNAADVRLAVTDEPLRVLVHEPRPSWNAAFVRRVLEQDASFEVSSLVQASKGLEVRAGDPPATLTAATLTAFAVVVIGAPEELTAPQVEALQEFTRRRGGTVVLLPDRRPSGRYLELVHAQGFDEVLLDNAVELRTPGAAPLRASELALPVGPIAADTLATFTRGTDAKPVVFERPSGAGRILFSGALDAWRHRAAADDGFARFWKGRIAEAALAAPRRLELSVEPGIPTPGEPALIRVRVRPTEYLAASELTTLPSLTARLVDARGGVDAVRLWPTTEPGVFEGRFDAPAAGAYDLRVEADGGATADAMITVADANLRPAGPPEATAAALGVVAASTGGVLVTAGNLGPLEQHLRALPRPEVERTMRPARSFVLVLVFMGFACAEWTLRRRRGSA